MLCPAERFVIVRYLFHRNATVDRAHAYAQIAAHTLVVDDFEMPLAVYGVSDGLVRSIFANDMTTTTLDAQVLVDDGFLNVVEIQVPASR